MLPERAECEEVNGRNVGEVQRSHPEIVGRLFSITRPLVSAASPYTRRPHTQPPPGRRRRVKHHLSPS